ncbi:hypothetical protein LINGRAHAP2_LOCUS12890 [Linum grandiflorum]
MSSHMNEALESIRSHLLDDDDFSESAVTANATRLYSGSLDLDACSWSDIYLSQLADHNGVNRDDNTKPPTAAALPKSANSCKGVGSDMSPRNSHVRGFPSKSAAA